MNITLSRSLFRLAAAVPILLSVIVLSTLPARASSCVFANEDHDALQAATNLSTSVRPRNLSWLSATSVNGLPRVPRPQQLQVAKAAPSTRQPPECLRVSASTCSIAAALGRGINMGNMLESPHEGQWGITYKGHYPSTIKAAGFTHVRLPVRWSNHASPDAAATLYPEFLARVDQIVDDFLVQGLYVIVNMHHYRQLDGKPPEEDKCEVAVDPAVLEDRFVNLWRQIANHYQGYSDHLLFELYNEPHDAQTPEIWNARYPKALAAIRDSNPTRVVMVGPSEWNTADALVNFTPQNDPHTVVTFHHYVPDPFTHQGAWGKPYSPCSRTCCSSADLDEISAVFDAAKQWSIEQGKPIYLGEFGSHISAPHTSRVNYAKAMRSGAESRGMSWAVWNFGSDFGVYDVLTDQWNADLLGALVPSRHHGRRPSVRRPVSDIVDCVQGRVALHAVTCVVSNKETDHARE